MLTGLNFGRARLGYSVIEDAARKSLEAMARKPRRQPSKQVSSNDQRDVYGL